MSVTAIPPSQAVGRRRIVEEEGVGGGMGWDGEGEGGAFNQGDNESIAALCCRDGVGGWWVQNGVF